MTTDNDRSDIAPETIDAPIPEQAERPRAVCSACDGAGIFQGVPCGWCRAGEVSNTRPCGGCGKRIPVTGPHHHCVECILRQRAERAESRIADLEAKLRWHESYWRPPGDENNPVSIGVIWEQLKIAEARVEALEGQIKAILHEMGSDAEWSSCDLGEEAIEVAAALVRQAEATEAAEAKIKELEAKLAQTADIRATKEDKNV